MGFGIMTGKNRDGRKWETALARVLGHYQKVLLSQEKVHLRPHSW